MLIVEDSFELRLALQLGLTQEGWQVVLASDGLEGVQKFHSTNPDLVILDLRMPGMDGSAVCRAIRKTSLVPVVIFSALDQSAEVNNAISAGATDFVLKSSGLAELVRRIHKYVQPVRVGGGEKAPAASPVPATPATPHVPATPAPPEKVLSLLVVDPDFNASRVTADEIKKLGHTAEVIRTTDSFDRLRQLPRPDIVVLDYSMPHRLGIDYVEDLANSRPKPQLGLVIASRSNPVDLRRRLRNCLLLDFIEKPWQAWEFPLRLKVSIDLYIRRMK